MQNEHLLIERPQVIDYLCGIFICYEHRARKSQAKNKYFH